MQKQTIKSKQEGFTIIEVLIVLAIAALILLVVFLAVPGLQRSQTNNAIKNDATHIATAFTNYYSNNNSAWPTTTANITTIVNDTAGISKLMGATTNVKTATTMPTTLASNNWYYITDNTAYTTPPTANGTYATIAQQGVTCASTYGTAVSTVTGNASNLVLITPYVTGGTNQNWNCLIVQ